MLTAFLSREKPFTEFELLKLWKGLFYCLWMSDKPLAQQNLAREYAAIISKTHDNNTLPFISAFWVTLVRQWESIDRYRLDKYYFLVRQMNIAIFNWLNQKKWDNELLENYNTILYDNVLSPLNHRLPLAIKYHLFDSYLDSLGQSNVSKLPVEAVVEPFQKFAKEAKGEQLKRARSMLNDKRWDEYR